MLIKGTTQGAIAINKGQVILTLPKLNWNLVYGTNALHINPNVSYVEVFIGLENIFKLFRFDVLGSYQNGHSRQYTYRIGFDGLLCVSVNSMHFSKKKKIINDY